MPKTQTNEKTKNPESEYKNMSLPEGYFYDDRHDLPPDTDDAPRGRRNCVCPECGGWFGHTNGCPEAGADDEDKEGDEL